MLLFSLGVDGGHLGRCVALLARSLAEVAIFVGQLWGPVDERREQNDRENNEQPTGAADHSQAHTLHLEKIQRAACERPRSDLKYRTA